MREIDNMQHGVPVQKSNRRESPARSEHTGDRPTPEGSLHRHFALEFLIANARLTFRLTRCKLSPLKISNRERIAIFHRSFPSKKKEKSKAAGLKPAATKAESRAVEKCRAAAGHSRGGPWGNWRPAGCALVKRDALRYWVWDLGEMLRARSFPLSAF
jgi:hypothetical protein